MLKLMLMLILMGGCSSSATKSSQLAKQSPMKWTFVPNESLVYAVRAEGEATVNGKKQGDGSEISDYLFIDVDPKGRAFISNEGGQAIFGQTSMELLPDVSNLFFPFPQSSFSQSSLDQSFIVQNLGVTANQNSPDIEVKEKLTRTSDTGTLLKLSFSREGEASAKTMKMKLTGSGIGTFDAQHGRYQHIEQRMVMAMNVDLDDKKQAIELKVKYILTFDAELSKSRTKEQLQLHKGSQLCH